MIEKVLQALAKIPADKVAHFAAGAILALLGLLAGHAVDVVLGTGRDAAELGLFAGAVLGGLAKESWDLYHPPHVSDPFDFAATALGALPVWFAYFLGVAR